MYVRVRPCSAAELAERGAYRCVAAVDNETIALSLRHGTHDAYTFNVNQVW